MRSQEHAALCRTLNRTCSRGVPFGSRCIMLCVLMCLLPDSAMQQPGLDLEELKLHHEALLHLTEEGCLQQRSYRAPHITSAVQNQDTGATGIITASIFFGKIWRV